MGGSDSVQKQDGQGQDDDISGAERRGEHWELRCGFLARRRHGRRGKFAVGPHRAVLEIFLLPDGHSALESINGKAAGVKRGGSVGRAYGDDHAGFADFKTAEAVNNCDAMYPVLFVELCGDFSHFAEGHRFVGFIVKVKRVAIVRLIADKTVEGDDGAVFGRSNLAHERVGINRPVNQLANIIVIARRRHRGASRR